MPGTAPELRDAILHHQRCLACGAEGFSSTTRSAVTFRHKHRKRCPGAEFERIVR